MAFKIKYFKGKYKYVENLEEKQKIVDTLFESIDLSQFRYILLNESNYEEKFNSFKKNKHYISLHFKGSNYLLYFCTFDNKHCCFCIDRKTLKYNKDQIDYHKLLIIKLMLKANSNMFKGSIFNCRFSNINSIAQILITDCYELQGSKNILKMNLNEKLNLIKTNFNIYFSKTENINLIINKIYDVNSNIIKNLVDSINSYEIDCIGLIFYPDISGNELIFLENNNSNNITKNNTKQIEKLDISFVEHKAISENKIFNLAKILLNRTYSYEKEGDIKELFLKKTDITDVYNIFDLNKKRLGIAYIPNLKISYLCYNNIKTNTDYYKFKCIFNKNKNKWIPLEKVNDT